MKKAIFGVCIALMTLSMLSACAGAPTACAPAAAADQSGAVASASIPEAPALKTPPPAEPVTIRTTITDGELSKDQIAAFEKLYPHIKVEIEAADSTKLAAELATNSAPDVIRINGAFEASGYIIRGIATDITNRLETGSVIKMNELLPICNVYRFDGKTIGQGPYYGLPKDWSNDYAVFYNKKCFDAAGVEVPDASRVMTWEDIFALAKRLTIVKDNRVEQYGLSANEWGQTVANFNLMLQYVQSAGDKISADGSSAIDFNAPSVENFIRMWVDGVKAGIGPNPLNNDQTPGGDLFLANKSAMIINGYWYSGVIRSSEVTKTHLDDFGMLPTPMAANGARVAPTGGATGAILYSGSKHQDEAWAFFEWYFGGPPAQDRAKSGWGMPITASLVDLLPQETSFDRQVLKVLGDESAYQKSFLPVNPYLAGGGWGIFDKYVAPLYFDKSTLEEAIVGMTKDANVVVSEAKAAVQ